MTWRNKLYREDADLLGVVCALMAINRANYEPISDVDIRHYIRLAQRYRDVFKEEKAQQNGTRTDSQCVVAVLARLQLPQSDYNKFYPNRQDDYLTPERVFLLACVAVTGSREGASLLASIALSTRTLKGLKTHINQYLIGSSVLNE